MTYLSTVLTDSPAGVWTLSESSGTFADSSGNSLTMTAHGSITRSVSSGKSAIQLGASFGGTIADFIDTPSNALLQPTSNMTYETWVKFASVTGSNQCFMCLGAQSTTDGCGFGLLGASSKLFIFLTSAGTTVISGNTALSAGTLYHVAVTQVNASQTWTLYINGVQDNQAVSSPLPHPAAPYDLGVDNTGSSGLALPLSAGSAMWTPAVYGTALSAGQVAAHYAAGIAAVGGPPIKNSPPPSIVGRVSDGPKQHTHPPHGKPPPPTPAPPPPVPQRRGLIEGERENQ